MSKIWNSTFRGESSPDDERETCSETSDCVLTFRIGCQTSIHPTTMAQMKVCTPSLRDARIRVHKRHRSAEGSTDRQ